MWQVWSKLRVEAVKWVRSGESVIPNLGNATLCFNGCFGCTDEKPVCLQNSRVSAFQGL